MISFYLLAFVDFKLYFIGFPLFPSHYKVVRRNVFTSRKGFAPPYLLPVKLFSRLDFNLSLIHI